MGPVPAVIGQHLAHQRPHLSGRGNGREVHFGNQPPPAVLGLVGRVIERHRLLGFPLLAGVGIAGVDRVVGLVQPRIGPQAAAVGDDDVVVRDGQHRPVRLARLQEPRAAHVGHVAAHGLDDLGQGGVRLVGYADLKPGDVARAVGPRLGRHLLGADVHRRDGAGQHEAGRSHAPAVAARHVDAAQDVVGDHGRVAGELPGRLVGRVLRAVARIVERVAVHLELDRREPLVVAVLRLALERDDRIGHAGPDHVGGPRTLRVGREHAPQVGVRCCLAPVVEADEDLLAQALGTGGGEHRRAHRIAVGSSRRVAVDRQRLPVHEDTAERRHRLVGKADDVDQPLVRVAVRLINHRRADHLPRRGVGSEDQPLRDGPACRGRVGRDPGLPLIRFPADRRRQRRHSDAADGVDQEPRDRTGRSKRVDGRESGLENWNDCWHFRSGTRARRQSEERRHDLRAS